MEEEHPYRGSAAPEVWIAWETNAQALDAMHAHIAVLRAAGVALDGSILEVRLRPYVLALLDADADSSVHVAWEIARELNRILAGAAVEARFHRAGERSPRFVLLSPAEVEARRAAGEVLLARPPSVGPKGPVLVATAAAFLALAMVAGALVWVGAYLVLAATAIAFVIAYLLALMLAKRDPPWKWAGLLLDVPLAIPLVALAHRGELLLLGLVAAALAAAAIAKRWAREPSVDARDGGGSTRSR